MGAGDAAGTRQHPDRVIGEAQGTSVEIAVSTGVEHGSSRSRTGYFRIERSSDGTAG
jgi:hypothetical protein